MATVQEYLKNDKWVKRLGEFFTQLDVNKNGYLSREDFLLHVDNLAKAVPDNPDAIAKLRKAALEYANELGVVEGVKIDKQKYVERVAALVVDDLAKVKRGVMTSFQIHNRALCDVVDRNHDGRLTFEEYKLAIMSVNFDENASRATFDLLDRNKDGTIETKDFVAANTNFWLTCDDANTKGMFGDKFE